MARDRAEAAPVRWADLRLRVLSAVVLAPLAVGLVWVGGAAWDVLISLAALWLAAEWVHLCGAKLEALPGLLVPLAVVAAGVVAAGATESVALLVLVAGFAVTWLVASLGPGRRLGRPASLAAGVLYIGLALVALFWLRHDAAAGRRNVLFLILVVWASDVGAFLAGRLLAGPRLAPRISPSKTWTGAVGGLLAAIGVGYGVAMASADPGGLQGWSWGIALVAAFLGVASQLGDLFESAVKRRFGVKDSGRLIPGHGGLLDRLDGLLAAGPAAALLALALGPGGTLWQWR